MAQIDNHMVGILGIISLGNPSIIHDVLCSLIHKKCHPKSYHNDIKWHMTLNIIFSVPTIVFVCKVPLHTQVVLYIT